VVLVHQVIVLNTHFFQLHPQLPLVALRTFFSRLLFELFGNLSLDVTGCVFEQETGVDADLMRLIHWADRDLHLHESVQEGTPLQSKLDIRMDLVRILAELEFT